jgi:putative transposase
MDQLAILLTCLNSLINSSIIDSLTAKRLGIISEAMLCMTGRVTMLGISRWTEKGGSYRTIQRFFKTCIPWEHLNWSLIKAKISKTGVLLIAGDTTTVTKSGKTTFGIGKFFSSIYSRAIPGISFQVLSLINVDKRKSSPVLVEQVMPKPKGKKENKRKKTKKKGPGRPKGSKNKDKRDVALNAELMQIKAMLIKLLSLIGGTIKPIYFVYDAALGTNAAVQMIHQIGQGLQLISKLQYNS